MPSQIDSEKVKKHIAEILEKIQTKADLNLLNQYRSMLKKEVPFFSSGRPYVAAYLLMEYERSGGRGFGGGNRSRGLQENPQAEPKTYSLGEEESARLFIGAGRSRRVFPREILGLIISKTSVSREDIGAIRILDNYSFVQVRTTKADEIIEAVNGITFRGRPLAVNYARNRKEENPAAPDEERYTGDAVPDEAQEPSPKPMENSWTESETPSVEQDDDHTNEEDV